MKILGSMADAEHMVHDTFVKWLTCDKQKIKNTKAYLINDFKREVNTKFMN